MIDLPHLCRSIFSFGESEGAREVEIRVRSEKGDRSVPPPMISPHHFPEEVATDDFFPSATVEATTPALYSPQTAFGFASARSTSTAATWKGMAAAPPVTALRCTGTVGMVSPVSPATTPVQETETTEKDATTTASIVAERMEEAFMAWWCWRWWSSRTWWERTKKNPSSGPSRSSR